MLCGLAGGAGMAGPVMGLAEENGGRPHVFREGGAKFIGGVCVTSGPGEKDRRGKVPARGVPSVG